MLSTNDLDNDLTAIVLRKRSHTETPFQDAKKVGGLAACHCEVDEKCAR